MSLRPREAVEEASTFSLRSVFSTAPAAPEPATSATAAEPAALQHSQQQQAHPLQYHHHFAQPASPTKPVEVPFLGLSLGAPALPHAALGGGGGSGLKFNLPQLKKPGAAAARVPSAAALADTGRSLRPGFLTGGSGDSAEVLRLNALVEDLSTKQRQMSEKLALAEQSVARGNAALTSERAMSNARITALSAEVKSAQQREIAVRTELANVPRMEALNKEKFKLQAEGAVELQARHEELTEKAAVLEGIVHEMKIEREAIVEQHTLLATQLDEAKAALEVAEARMATTLEGGGDAPPTSEAAAEPPFPDAAVAAAEAADAEVAALAARLAEKDCALEKLRVDCCEADTLNKSLDLKLHEVRAEREAAVAAAMREAEEARAALEELELQAAEDVPTEFQEQFDAYHACKARAEELQARVQEAGVEATAEDVAEMAKARMEARRMHRAVVTGEAPKTSVSVVRLDELDEHAERAAAAAGVFARTGIETGLNAGGGGSIYGTSAPAQMDCSVDFCRMSAHEAEACAARVEEGWHVLETDEDDGEGTMVTFRQDEATAKKLRIDAMVKAVSVDLKYELKHCSERFCPGAVTGVGA